MSLNKTIAYGKEHRKPYTGAKCVDPSCRNHGGCEWCEENRKFKHIRKEQKMISREEEYYGTDTDEDEDDS